MVEDRLAASEEELMDARKPRRMVSFFSARARVVSILAAIALVAGISVAPAASASIGRTTYSTTRSGYVVSGRWFHFIQTNVQLPTNTLCIRLHRVLHGGTFSVTAELDGSGTSAQLVIQDTPTSTGCGTYTVELVNAGQTTPSSFAMSPGDSIEMWVLYDQKSPLENGEHSISGHLLDRTSGNGLAIGDLANAIYTSARVMATFSSFTAPASQFRPFEFTGSAAQTYSGHEGTLIGAWTTHQVVMTSNGRANGTVEASSPVLWDGGRNFGTWLRVTA
jgi:hypothetical protein